MQVEIIIYVADAGSVAKGNFHWVSSRDLSTSSTDPQELAAAVSADLNTGRRVALGYESPLFVPVDEDPGLLGKSREGECEKETGNRPFTAGAGASVLATGIQSLAWVLREVKKLCPDVAATTRWSDFYESKVPLLIWEAFVSGSEKAFPPSHSGDAALAVTAFRNVLAKRENPTRVRCDRAFSLAGAAICYSGLSGDCSLLTDPCIVLRPIFTEEEAKGRLAGYKLRQAEVRRAKTEKTKGREQ